MTRVRRERSASVRSAAARHKTADKKPSYKVIVEEITQKKKPLKTHLSFSASPPPGYTFIPAGDPQLTKRCKRYTKAAGVAVYIVSTFSNVRVELSKEVHRVGYHFSTRIVDKACESLGVTLNASGRVVQSHLAYLDEDERGDRFQSRQERLRKSRPVVRPADGRLEPTLSQALIDTQARDAIHDLFPQIPARDAHDVISRAFEKNRRLVGSAAGMSLVRRANLAVVAHIRHTYTNYDQLLRSGFSWADARRGVGQFTLDKLISWRGEEEEDDDPNMEDVLREVVVISDDEDADASESSADRAASSNLMRNEPLTTMPTNVLQSTAIDLTASDEDEDEDSDDDDSDIYIPQVIGQLSQSNPMRASKQARLREERLAKWHQAIVRRKNRPLPADVDDRISNAILPTTVSRVPPMLASDAAVSIPGPGNYDRPHAVSDHGMRQNNNEYTGFMAPMRMIQGESVHQKVVREDPVYRHHRQVQVDLDHSHIPMALGKSSQERTQSAFPLHSGYSPETVLPSIEKPAPLVPYSRPAQLEATPHSLTRSDMWEAPSMKKRRVDHVTSGLRSNPMARQQSHLSGGTVLIPLEQPQPSRQVQLLQADSEANQGHTHVLLHGPQQYTLDDNPLSQKSYVSSLLPRSNVVRLSENYAPHAHSHHNKIRPDDAPLANSIRSGMKQMTVSEGTGEFRGFIRDSQRNPPNHMQPVQSLTQWRPDTRSDTSTQSVQRTERPPRLIRLGQQINQTPTNAPSPQSYPEPQRPANILTPRQILLPTMAETSTRRPMQEIGRPEQYDPCKPMLHMENTMASKTGTPQHVLRFSRNDQPPSDLIHGRVPRTRDIVTLDD